MILDGLTFPGKKSMRNSEIRLEPYAAPGKGSQGPDTTFVVYLYEDEILFEKRKVPGKSVHYAESLARNWDEGNGEFKIDK